MAAPRNREHLLPTASCPGSRAPRVSRPQGRLSTSDQTATELLQKDHTVSLCLLCQEHKPSPQFTWLMPTYPTGPGLRAAFPSPQPSPPPCSSCRMPLWVPIPARVILTVRSQGLAFERGHSVRKAAPRVPCQHCPWTRWSAHRKCSIHQTNQRRMGQ